MNADSRPLAIDAASPTAKVRATLVPAVAPTLLVFADGEASSFSLTGGPQIVIGRGDDCAVRINHPSISRRHALLRLGPPLTIEDLGSANGTGLRCKGLKPGTVEPLRSGDVLMLGTVMVVIHGAPADHRRSELPPVPDLQDAFSAAVGADLPRGRCVALLYLAFEAPPPPGLAEEIVDGVIRSQDVRCRRADGGVEILVGDTDPGEALEVVTRLYGALFARGVGACIGLALCPDDGRTLAELRERASGGIRAQPSKPGQSPMCDLQGLIERVAASTISVLLLGETGVGKEVMAEAVHRLSPRASRPFLRLNCAALSAGLLESELFGHEKGAFTGAIAQKAGLLETAEGGTVFLDEVGELPLETQVKLLRVIEERKVTRVGALSPRAIDVRFIAATHRDLEALIASGAFRQDLYFRLNGISLVIPPLRLRIDEIDELARTFVAQACERAGREEPPSISADALALLRAYRWPGNIRELRNVMDRAVVLCGAGDILPTHLPISQMLGAMTAAAEPAEATAAAAPRAPVATPTAAAGPAPADEGGAAERARILQALERFAGNQTAAARALGLSRNTLLARLDRYGITRPRKK